MEWSPPSLTASQCAKIAAQRLMCTLSRLTIWSYRTANRWRSYAL